MIVQRLLLATFLVCAGCIVSEPIERFGEDNSPRFSETCEVGDANVLWKSIGGYELRGFEAREATDTSPREFVLSWNGTCVYAGLHYPYMLREGEIVADTPGLTRPSGSTSPPTIVILTDDPAYDPVWLSYRSAEGRRHVTFLNGTREVLLADQ